MSIYRRISHCYLLYPRTFKVNIYKIGLYVNTREWWCCVRFACGGWYQLLGEWGGYGLRIDGQGDRIGGQQGVGCRGRRRKGTHGWGKGTRGGGGG